MTTKMAKATSKGQLTLPKEWRTQFDTNDFLLELHNQKIVVKPVSIKELAAEEVLFDANRDNDGNGVSVDEMIRLLKKIRNEQN